MFNGVFSLTHTYLISHILFFLSLSLTHIPYSYYLIFSLCLVSGHTISRWIILALGALVWTVNKQSLFFFLLPPFLFLYSPSLCVCVCVCVYVCVCEREHSEFLCCLSVYVCVCELNQD